MHRVSRRTAAALRRSSACPHTACFGSRASEVGSRLVADPNDQRARHGAGYLDKVKGNLLTLETSSENSMVELERELMGEMAQALCRTEDRVKAALRALDEAEERFKACRGAREGQLIEEFNAARAEVRTLHARTAHCQITYFLAMQAIDKRRELIIHRQAAGFVRGNYELVTEIFPIFDKLDCHGNPIVHEIDRDLLKARAREANRVRLQGAKEYSGELRKVKTKHGRGTPQAWAPNAQWYLDLVEQQGDQPPGRGVGPETTGDDEQRARDRERRRREESERIQKSRAAARQSSRAASTERLRAATSGERRMTKIDKTERNWGGFVEN